MSKYTIIVHHKNGKSETIEADQIIFHSGKGGVDIYREDNPIPIFPWLEEDTYRTEIYFNKPSR